MPQRLGIVAQMFYPPVPRVAEAASCGCARWHGKCRLHAPCVLPSRLLHRIQPVLTGLVGVGGRGREVGDLLEGIRDAIDIEVDE